MSRLILKFIPFLLVCSSLLAISSGAIIQRIAVNDEEIIFSLDNYTDVSTTNYSYPAYYPYESLVHNNTIKAWENISKSDIYEEGFFDSMNTNGFASYYSFTKTNNAESTDSIKSVLNSSSFILYDDITGIFMQMVFAFSFGIVVKNYTTGRLITLSTSASTNELISLSVNSTDVILNCFDDSNTKYNYQHFNETIDIKLFYNNFNHSISIYVNQSLFHVLTVDSFVGVGIPKFLKVGNFNATTTGANMSVYQTYYYTGSLGNDNMLLVESNTEIDTYEISSVLINNVICYNSTQYTFRNATLNSLAFHFNMLIQYVSRFTIILTKDVYDNPLYNVRDTANLRFGFNINPLYNFNMIYVNQSGIAIYNNTVLLNTYLAIVLGGIDFNEITFIFDNYTVLKGWNSDYMFKITANDIVDSTTFSLFDVLNTQPIKHTDEYNEPVVGLLISKIFAYYGSWNYTNNSQMYNSSLFIADSLLSNGKVYMDNSTDLYFSISGTSGLSYINYEGVNQTRSYFRLLFTRLNALYKLQITKYDIEQNVVINRIIQFAYPIQLDFHYNSSVNSITCINYEPTLFTLFSNQSIRLENTQATLIHVFDEAQYNQTFVDSKFTRKLISASITKNFASDETNLNTVFEQLLSVDSSFSVIDSSLLNSAGLYSDLEDSFDSQQFALNAKLSTTYAYVANYRNILSYYIYSSIIDSKNFYESTTDLQKPFGSDTNILEDFFIQAWAEIVVYFTGSEDTEAVVYNTENWYSGAENFYEEVESTYSFTDDYSTETTVYYEDGTSEEVHEIPDWYNDVDEFLDVELTFDNFMIGLLDLSSSILSGMLTIINVLSESFITPMSNLLTDLVGYQSSFNQYSPKDSTLTIAFSTIAFVDNTAEFFKIIISTQWLLGDLADTQSLFSFLLSLGVSVLIFFVIPAVVHMIKHNAILTYLSCIISSLVMSIIGLLHIGIALLGIVISTMLMIFKIKKERDIL